MTLSGYAEPTWGAVKYLRQREVSPLSEADAAVIIKARDLYGEAVQASTAAALSGQAGVVGDYVRQAYVKVGCVTNLLNFRRWQHMCMHSAGWSCTPEPATDGIL